MAGQLPKSPLAPAAFPALPRIAGMRISCIQAGYKYKDRNDLLLVVFDREVSAAGVMTRSATASDEVEWCRKCLERENPTARAMVVSAGNSNAFTGKRGKAALDLLTGSIANALTIPRETIFPSATGVIGEPLPAEKAVNVLNDAIASLGSATLKEAALAITTTDTFPKGAGSQTEIVGTPVSISGIAKGSGMIAPDMATMLAYIYTDANIAPAALQTLVKDAADQSFNRITVDSDTSTSDTFLLFATGHAPHEEITDPADARLTAFRTALNEVAIDLAKQIVCDGEGAQKFISVRVNGASTDLSAHKIALSIANSPLVKTAIAGGDANWGRVVMAVGKAGEPADRDRMTIRFGETLVAAEGAAVDDYDETPVAAHLAGQKIDLAVDVGVGDGQAEVWTCDLTHGYISINADYRS
ncbi:MAG: bifunctional glutamate N-acetyltransferase/amino-acid acetyltransferase ArgJ [Pseudomonadota bacterium]